MKNRFFKASVCFIYTLLLVLALGSVDAFAATEPVEGLTTRGAFFDPINSLVTGDKTQDDWVKGFKEASDAFRAALK